MEVQFIIAQLTDSVNYLTTRLNSGVLTEQDETQIRKELSEAQAQLSRLQNLLCG